MKMNKRESENKKLYSIGRELLKTGAPPDDMLENIVSGPHLFNAIKQRVAAEQKTSAAGLSFASILSFLSRPQTAAAFAALMIAVLATGAFYFYARQTTFETVAKNGPPEISARKDSKPLVIKNTPGPDVIEGAPLRPTAVAFHQNRPAPVIRENFRKKLPVGETAYESDGEFYPLTYTGSSGEIAPGAQIVRVELPRSSLSSMGIDLADENRAGTVKADLLISSDGVARGVRLVR
jgi:hypothetical protein